MVSNKVFNQCEYNMKAINDVDIIFKDVDKTQQCWKLLHSFTCNIISNSLQHFCFNLELNGNNLIPSLQVSPRGPKTHTKSWCHDSLGRTLKIGHTHFCLVHLVYNFGKSDFIYCGHVGYQNRGFLGC